MTQKTKHRWQMSLRRYLIHGYKSANYSDYFGITQANFKLWIETQFVNGMNWDNYGTVWDFDHIIPVCYFDFTDKDDLILCWNFLNIQATRIPNNKNKSSRLDVPFFIEYFGRLASVTDYQIAERLCYKCCAISEQMRETHNLNKSLAFLKKTNDDWETFYNFLDFRRNITLS